MRIRLTTATAILLVLALSSAAWAGGQCRHRDNRGLEVRLPGDTGPDLNGDGRVTNYERIRYERKQRFERLHGN